MSALDAVRENTGLRDTAKRKRADPDGNSDDVHAVAESALDICKWIRDEDPKGLHRQLTKLAKERPGFVAQMAMALAAWTDVKEAPERRYMRAEAISQPHPGL